MILIHRSFSTKNPHVDNMNSFLSYSILLFCRLNSWIFIHVNFSSKMPHVRHMNSLEACTGRTWIGHTPLIFVLLCKKWIYHLKFAGVSFKSMFAHFKHALMALENKAFYKWRSMLFLLGAFLKGRTWIDHSARILALHTPGSAVRSQSLASFVTVNNKLNLL